MKIKILTILCLICITISEKDVKKLKTNTKTKKAPFIEEISDQGSYLPFLESEDLPYLDLISLNRSLKTSDFSNNSENEINCPNRIFKSFKLKSYLMPVLKAPSVTECPKMKDTCCTLTDIDRLKNLWDSKYSIYLDFNYQYFHYYIKEIFSHHDDIRKMAIAVKKGYQHEMCKNISEKIIKMKIDDVILNKIEKVLNELKTFDRNQKENFICMLCDYNSIRFWDNEKNIIPLNFSTCKKIVDSTFDNIYYMNNFVYKYLNTVNFLTYCVNTNNMAKFGDLNLEDNGFFDFLEIENSLSYENCKKAKDNNGNVITNCFKFCSDYNFWKFEKPAFRPVFKLAKIFNNLNDKVFKKELDFKISAPQNVHKILPIFEPEFEDTNIFEFYSYIFTEKEGIKPDIFFQKQNIE